jgi:hypothetical protein
VVQVTCFFQDSLFSLSQDVMTPGGQLVGQWRKGVLCTETPCVAREGQKSEAWVSSHTCCLGRKQAVILHRDACLQGQPNEQRMVFFMASL